MANKKPHVLCILDGWGLREEAQHNAVKLANTPCFDRLWSSGAYPTSQLEASGAEVGLPKGQIGNSEVGHLNLGAGRVVLQTLPRMNQAFDQSEVVKNEAFQRFVDLANTGSKRVHLWGLASTGGVHSHQDHIAALYNLLNDAGFEVLVHLVSDGRDVPPFSAANQWPDLFESIPKSAVASVCGRYFAMDRDKRWERVQRAFDAVVAGTAQNQFSDPMQAIDHAGQDQIGDEFIEPWVRQGYAGMADRDALVVANFRSDRVRQLLNAMLGFQEAAEVAGQRPQLSGLLAMTPYSEQISEHAQVVFLPEDLRQGLGEVAAAAGKTQLRLAETEKYPHVTFFFSGGREEPFDGEERFLAPSPKVATYDMAPQMSAAQVGERLEKAILAQEHDLIICNFANPDMVGHTGIVEAAVAACEAVDAQVQRAVDAIEKVGGHMLVTADHGNCELLWDEATNGPHTAHTTNPVPLILVSDTYKGSLKDGKLADIAPTLLKLMGVDQPVQMTGDSLVN